MVCREGKTVICSLFFCLTIISVANSAYGAVADASYCENWFSETNYETVQIESDDLYGCLRFFYAQNCLYCCISYVVDGMEGNENTAVEINISNSNRNYTIHFTADEENEFPCNLTKYFTRLTNLGQDIYFELEFTEKADKNTENRAAINLIIDNKSYYIALIDMPAGEDTAVAENDTTQSRIEEKEEEKETNATTKFTYSASGEHEEKEAETEASTKFSIESGGAYFYNENSLENDYDTSPSQANEVSGDTLIDVPVEKETSFSPQAKAMFGLSGAFAICGTAVLIRNAVKTSSAKKAELNNESPEKDD